MAEVLTRTGLYRLADEMWRTSYSKGDPSIRARWTGEKRPPKAGEWYLSGAIIEAYRAKADLDIPFHIAELVTTKTVTVVTGKA